MHRALIAASIGALALSACLPATGEDNALDDAPVVERTTPPPVADAPSEPQVAPEEPGRQEAVPHSTCTDDERVAIDAVIEQQLGAFADDDYDGALEFATPGFRERFTPESFREVIEQGFPAVARDARHRMQECVSVGEEPAGAQAVVTVTAADGEDQQLVYLMAFDGERWLIGGATPIAPTESEDTVTV